MELEAVEAVAAHAVAGSSAEFPSLSMEGAAPTCLREHTSCQRLTHEQPRKNLFSIFNSQREAARSRARIGPRHLFAHDAARAAPNAGRHGTFPSVPIRRRSRASHGDDDLASGVAPLEVPDRVGSLDDRIRRADDRRYLVRLDQLRQGLEVVPVLLRDDRAQLSGRRTATGAAHGAPAGRSLRSTARRRPRRRSRGCPSA